MISIIDIILIIFYFVSIAIIGYLSSKKESSAEFILANKKLSVWENIATLVSTKITATVIVTYVALVYVFGISAIWVYIGTALGFSIFLLFAIKLKKEGDLNNYYSIADYFYKRCGQFTGMFVSILMYVLFLFNFAIQLLAGAKILQVLTGISFLLGILLCSIVILFYLYRGGFKAVIKIDNMQFISIMLLFIVLLVFLFSNFTYDITQWKLMSAGPKFIIPFLVAGILIPFSAPDMWQRVLAAKSVKSLKKSFIITTIIFVVFGFILSLIAIIIRLKLPAINAETALIAGFTQLLPNGLLGLGIVALFAAIMSSADSFAFICSGFLMQNIAFHNKKHNKVKWLKYGLLITIILGVIIAISFESILKATFLLSGLLMVLSIVVLTTWIKKYVKSLIINYSLIIGILFTTSFAIFKGISAMLIVIGILGGLIGLIIGIMVSFVRQRIP